MQFYSMSGNLALGSRLRRLGDVIGKDAKAIYQCYGNDLDPRWFPVFYMLKEQGPAAITELASAIGQSHPAVSQVVKKMAEAGLIEIKQSENDSRVNLASLTEKGWRLHKKMIPQCDDVERAVAEIFEQAGVDLSAALEAIEYQLSQASLLQRVIEIRKHQESAKVEIITFEKKHKAAFKALNLAWISQHWTPEQSDFDALDKPVENITSKGGHITIATLNDDVVGTCALIKMKNGDYELAKMAVAESAKGRGIGLLLGRDIIDKAIAFGAKRIYLESNAMLKPALSLYRKLGFTPVTGQPSPYERCNVQMELLL